MNTPLPNQVNDSVKKKSKTVKILHTMQQKEYTCANACRKQPNTMQLQDFLPTKNGKFYTPTNEPLLVYDSANGVYIYKYVMEHAIQLGYQADGTEDEIEDHDTFLDILNSRCEECQFEWNTSGSCQTDTHLNNPGMRAKTTTISWN